MKRRILGLYRVVLANLPVKYHRPALFFPSEKKMLEYAAKRMRVSYKKARDVLYGVCSSEDYQQYEFLLPRKYQIKESNSILGLAFADEVLFNCYGLNKESDSVIKFTILHELGHSNDKKKHASFGRRERAADKFALKHL